MTRVAVIEDDPEASADLSQMLSTRHRVTAFADGASFLRALHRETFDLICVDWSLPDMTGQEVIERVREGTVAKMVPIIVITSRDGDDDLVTGLVSGADDFISKPARESVLLARIDALLRRASPAVAKGLEVYGPYVFDRSREVVSDGRREHSLTNKEFALALILFRNMHRPLSRTYLLEEVWGNLPAVSSRTLDTHVCRLKSKLNLGPDNGFNFGPVYGYGYRLERLDPADAAPGPI